MVLLVKPIKTGDDVTALGELTPQDTAEIVGPLVVQSDSEFNSTGGIKLPTGTTAERPATPKVGSTRFNTELGWAETWNGAEWLKGSGPAGSNGADGKSAYEIAVANGFVGTEAEWVDSLQGADGPTVVSQDADNIAILGTDGFIYVPKGSGGGGAAEVPVGTTAERPNPPVTGNLRFNTTLDRLEVFGNSFWQILKYDREATAPIIGTATATSNTTATLTYSPSANEANEGITGYYGISQPDDITASNSVTGAGTLSFVGLRQDTRYTFGVCAVNPVGRGTFAGPSNEILTFSVPQAPLNPLASFSARGQALIAFSAPAYDGGTPITSYTAVATPSGLTGTLSQAGGGTIAISGLSINTEYTFTVYATNQYGNSPMSVASAPATQEAISTKLMLVAGGGGGHGDGYGGGGGGGGGGIAVSDSLFILKKGAGYTINVGAGGAYQSGNGGDSSMNIDGFNVIAYGGGRGSGVAGGSGGGSAQGYGTAGAGATLGTSTGSIMPAATNTYFGNNGGAHSGRLDGSNRSHYGGGGGAGQAGNGNGQGTGGNGIAIAGFAQFGIGGLFAGGGGAGGYRSESGPQYAGTAGGSGGGGPSGSNGASAGAPNSGGAGGGGAGGERGNIPGAGGGSGFAAICYPAPQIFTGGAVSESNGLIYHAFTTSGTLTPI